jgi:hypothetical protein
MNCFLSGTSKVLIVFYLKLQRYEMFSIWNFKGMNCFLSGTIFEVLDRKQFIPLKFQIENIHNFEGSDRKKLIPLKFQIENN